MQIDHGGSVPRERYPEGVTARRASVLVAVCLALAACQPATPIAPTTTSPSPSAPSSSASATIDYTAPGEAESVLKQLASLAGSTDRLLRIVITKDTAELSVLRDKQAVTYRAQNGELAEADDSDLQYVGQSTFSLADFNLADVGLLFRQAADLSGSDAAQELQIVDYNNQQVLMTVTTNPESLTVFFQPDGTPVEKLDFTTEAGLRQGIKDVVGDKSRVLALGTLLGAGLYADTPGPDDTTNRTMRTAQFPAWTAGRNEKPKYAEFDPSVVDPAVVADVIGRLPSLTGNPKEAGVQVTIDMRDERLHPTMRFQIGSKTIVTDLAGNDITDEVED